MCLQQAKVTQQVQVLVGVEPPAKVKDWISGTGTLAASILHSAILVAIERAKAIHDCATALHVHPF